MGEKTCSTCASCPRADTCILETVKCYINVKYPDPIIPGVCVCVKGWVFPLRTGHCQARCFACLQPQKNFKNIVLLLPPFYR